MNAEVTYDLYEEPWRWSRSLIIASVIAVALLALWIFVPPALQRFTQTTETPHPDLVATPQPDRPFRLHDATTTSSASYSAPGAVTAATTDEPPRTALSEPQDAHASIEQDGAAPALPPTNALAQTVAPTIWAPIQPSSPPPESAFEADAEPIAHPPLPRGRPHQLTLAGSLAIPLPHPRPFIPTETTGTVPEPTAERPDFF